MFEIDERCEMTDGGDPVAGMRALLGDLAGEDRAEWLAPMLSERLVELLEVRDRLDAEVLCVTAQWRRRRSWEADGALSPVAWLTYRAPMARSEARALVKSAAVIDDAPSLAEALASGDTTSAHVAALGRVVSERRRPLLVEHQEVLAEQAGRLSIRDFTLLTRRWAAIADDHLATDDHGEHQSRNVVHAGVTMDGWVDGTFHLDPIAGTTLLGVLDHLAPPDPKDAPDGPRTLSQRRGDALSDLGSWYHQGTEPGTNPPSLNVTVDVATLNGDTPELAQLRCELEGVGPVTRATLERMACGAVLRRVVMAGPSVVLDMGRKARLATKAQARAVRIRDGGCIFPSCDRPARWCDIHHVDSWIPEGPTDLDNLVCLCTRHHTMVHNTKWTIHINPDATYTTTHPTRAP